MEFVAWSIAVIIAVVLVVVVFCVMCGIVAEEKGRSLWWAVMGLFNIFGLIAVLLLERTVASELNRMIAIERAREGSLSPDKPSQSIGSRGDTPRRYRPSTSGASHAQGPVGAWLTKGDDASDALPSEGALGQELPRPAERGRQSQEATSPVDNFLNTEVDAGPGKSGQEAR